MCLNIQGTKYNTILSLKFREFSGICKIKNLNFHLSLFIYMCMAISPIIAMYVYILLLISSCINIPNYNMHGDHIMSDISYLTLPSLTHLAPLKSLITLYINICKITFFPSTQYAYIYDSIFICKLCYKDKLGQTYIYICILSGRKKCDKYAIIFICKLYYKDKLGQTDKVLRVLMMFLVFN